MPNGFLHSTMGTLSQVIIIPKPLSDSLYYIITTKVQASGTLTMQYHVVNMNRNGGFGDVISKNDTITNLNITEQIAATYHNNGTDIWLLTHEYGTNHFLAFLVTSTGISLSPVISSIGRSHMACTSNINARGEIKFSPNGNKVAFNANGIGGAGNDSTNILALFDFNNSTGIVSNPINLPFSRGEYGLTFSPDNSKLYGATWKAFGFSASDSEYVYQFDLSSGIPTNIINSKTILHSATVAGSIYGDLKIGPDGKIYIGKFNASYFDVINYPNLPGLSCNYIPNSLYLQGKVGMYGLNNYIEYKNYCGIENSISNNQNTNDLNIFPNPTTSTFTVSSTINIKSLKVYDVLGAMVNDKWLMVNSGYTIDMSRVSKGIYFVEINTESTVVNRKLVVQ